MGMIIETRGYNIPLVTISTALTDSTKTEVGKSEDYVFFKNLVERGGIMRGKITLGSTPMDGTLICNPWVGDENKISITTLGNMGGTEPVIIQGIIENDNTSDKVYATVSAFTPAAKS